MRFESWQLVPKSDEDSTKQCARCKHVAAQALRASDPMDYFRQCGRKGGLASTPAKRNAAFAREAKKREQKGLVLAASC